MAVKLKPLAFIGLFALFLYSLEYKWVFSSYREKNHGKYSMNLGVLLKLLIKKDSRYLKEEYALPVSGA